MRWDTCGPGDLDRFVDQNDEIRNLKSAELCSDDGHITCVVLELEDGTLVSFESRKTREYSGVRMPLLVSINNNESKGNDDV